MRGLRPERRRAEEAVSSQFPEFLETWLKRCLRQRPCRTPFARSLRSWPEKPRRRAEVLPGEPELRCDARHVGGSHGRAWPPSSRYQRNRERRLPADPGRRRSGQTATVLLHPSGSDEADGPFPPESCAVLDEVNVESKVKSRNQMDSTSARSRLDRMLGVFADVHGGEGITALLLSLNIFLILMAYYVLKPVREALILGEGSAELKSYMSAGQVVLLAFIVPLYSRLVARFVRIRLINVVTVFFVSCLLLFYVLAQFHVPLAIVFFLWIGIFNLMVIAQFWSFANDIYTKDQGERLFAIVGFGASLGAVTGSRIADRLIEPVGIYQMMLVGAAILVAQLLLTNYLDRRGAGHAMPAAIKGASAPPATKGGSAPPKTSGSDAFALVFRTRYLLWMALMLMLLNWVNTTGEYILGSIVTDSVSKTVAAGGGGGLSTEQLIGDFYSKYFTYVNIVGLLLQLFV